MEAALHASQQLAQALGAVVGGGDVPTVPALYLDYLPPELRGAPKDFFVYRMDILAIAAAGGAGNGAFTVQSDSDFLITSIAAAVTDPAAPQTAVAPNGLTLELTDTGAGRNFQNGQLAFDTVVGTGQLPGYLPWPKFIDRASQVTGTVVNNQAAQAVDVRISFLGFKIFSPNQAGLR